jgi:peptide methionine sulfoxide reductase MsrA
MNEKSDKTLSDILNIPETIVKAEETPNIIQDTNSIKSIKRHKKELVNQDFNEARLNMKDLINTGFEAIDGMMKVATASDSPRAYEVVSILLKTMTEMNSELVSLHEKANKAIPQTKQVQSTTNNSIFVGSTKDLQNLINQSRSQLKTINNENINDEA